MSWSGLLSSTQLKTFYWFQVSQKVTHKNPLHSQALWIFLRTKCGFFAELGLMIEGPSDLDQTVFLEPTLDPPLTFSGTGQSCTSIRAVFLKLRDARTGGGGGGGDPPGHAPPPPTFQIVLIYTHTLFQPASLIQFLGWVPTPLDLGPSSWWSPHFSDRSGATVSTPEV